MVSGMPRKFFFTGILKMFEILEGEALASPWAQRERGREGGAMETLSAI
jgi:hypothetical protein